MSREILFRGKTEEHGVWAEGAYYKQTEFYGVPCEYHYIISSLDALEDNMMYYDRVIPETVGQYTELTDMNGKKIFEGDIIQTFYLERRGVCYVVKMSTERGGWYPFACDDGCGCCACDVAEPKRCEVIGNIHDNPELLEGVVQE